MTSPGVWCGRDGAVSGVVRGMIEGGGRVSGYFTSASGIHSYWGDALREGFQNILCRRCRQQFGAPKNTRKDPGRVQPLAIRPDDEQETEFLRSSDNWFRPASFATGPDGCLYICDMYRETIEHPWSPATRNKAAPRFKQWQRSRTHLPNRARKISAFSCPALVRGFRYHTH